jgi:DNA-binding SARP family transcriptional activator
MTLEVRLLGAPGVRLAGRDLSGTIGGKALALLAYLALAAPTMVGRGKIAGLLWPDKTEESSSYRLRHALWELRRALTSDDAGQDAPWLGADDTHCWLNLTSGAWVDALAFAAGVGQPPAAGAAPAPLAPGASAHRLAEAVTLYRGDLLDGLNLRDAPLFDEWLLVERERWQLAYLEALWRLAQLQQAAADDADAERTFRQLIAADPLRERSYRGLMGHYHRRGERAAALSTYQQCVRTLKIEMGIAPSMATEHLRRLLAQDAPPTAMTELAHAADLLRRGRHTEAWAACQTAEACIADPATLSQAVLLRAEIALAEGRPAESLDLIRAARQTLTGWFVRSL